MGKCKYCGKDAGFFRSKHDECEAKFRSGLNQINSIVANCFVTNEDFYLKEREIKAIVANSCIDAISLENEYVKVFDQAVDRYLNDGIISTREEQMVARFLQFTGMQQARLNENKSLEKVLQSKVLEDILSGNKPKPRITIAGDFPFMLGKTENLIWLFRNITLHQQKVRREYVGRSSGVSVRIMKGVYYRTGGFKGHPVETTVMQRVGVGSVCLTDKNLYFSSPEKSLKIPYSKILSVESYSNGVGLQKDGVNDKPIFLENINSWFVYNVIANLK
ncbi:hypothetical protein PN569_08270 [Parabacteroides merdae]|jgi:hypothetical protein|nr:hypothetical protein [Parabacteroides merdae]MDB8966907.1 hypothetical protein [Parabacteroides merdae]MDB8969942.1 hypothetical protein [Parabacteroides merdae]MDB8973483.1 hypothetical protein [Parabacteroides merdae]MDB8977736.1 hypothetical protein [Parabacteroides merdae]